MAKKKPKRWSVERRLEFIDFKLYWDGQINRGEIMEEFGVSVPQASNDISRYQEFAPKNLEYDYKERRYLASKVFKPAFITPDADAYLSLLNTRDGDASPELPAHDTVPLPQRNTDSGVLRGIVRAVKEKRTIEISYQSMSEEGITKRQIFPHAFAYDSFRWHVRAYCYSIKDHRDFLLPRITMVGELGDAAAGLSEDTDWSEIFLVSLKPHPKLTENQAKAVALDYNMTKQRIDVPVRLAMLYYFLKRFGLQEGDKITSDPRRQHVVLANPGETMKALARAEPKYRKQKT